MIKCACVDLQYKDCTYTHLVYNAPIIKDHTGPTELLHIWFHLNTTGDDPSWKVVIYNRDLSKKTAEMKPNESCHRGAE